MAGERLNSEKGIEHEKIKIKIGTIDKTNPRTIYIEGRTFVTPESERDNTQKDITDIKHALKKTINESLYESNVFENKFILDFSVAAGGIHMGKKSFMSFQIILKQKGEIPQKIADVKENSESMIIKIADCLTHEVEDRGYLLSKIKKNLPK